MIDSPEARLAVGDLAAAPPPDPNERWTQPYVYAFPVCEAVDAPPFAAKRSPGPGKQDVEAAREFSAWWATRRAAVETQVRARAERVERLRRQLEVMAR